MGMATCVHFVCVARQSVADPMLGPGDWGRSTAPVVDLL